MRRLIQTIIQKRNPNFSFDEALDSTTLFSFIWSQGWGILRGMKLLFLLKNPKMASLGKHVHFFNSKKITFGKFMKLGSNIQISALGRKGVLIGNNVSIGAFSRIIVSTSFNNLGEQIKIGNSVGIGEFAYLGGAGGLEIGDECIIGQYFSCHPENHISTELDVSIRHQGVTREGIEIGKNCWIGSKVTILDGVKIGDGCVIAAGAVVNKSFPKNTIIGGVPARILKTRK